ncbi:MerR family transcriptional regulator [Sorangium sp. So ce1014]|uniref:MerR family transcriptional regulator n=1 Tax=Sorangium sp. So ce1014 TaxID=3133326 RepID=UPI003F6169A1
MDEACAHLESRINSLDFVHFCPVRWPGCLDALVPAPPVAPRGYSAVELARAAGVSTGTIKHWFAEGLMDKPAFRGRRTA